MSEEMPCCAHTRVVNRNNDNGSGTITREWWQCSDCKTEFLPSRAVSYEIEKLRADLAIEREGIAQAARSHASMALQLAKACDERDTERTARESAERELAELRAGLVPGKAGVVVNWVHQFAKQQFGRGRHLSDSAADWIIKGVGALRMELGEARIANQILTESGVRGHEAVCALAKERDGLAAALDVRRSITALRERPLYPDESITAHAEALAALYKLLEMEPASILAAHDARLTAPLERRVEALERALRDALDRIQRQQLESACGVIGIALASTPREGTEEPKPKEMIEPMIEPLNPGMVGMEIADDLCQGPVAELEPAAARSDDYVAWLRYKTQHERPTTIHVCDSDAPGAFKVYRHPQPADPPADREQATIADYEETLADHRRLVRELDVILNGDGAAPQASLCDIVAQVQKPETTKLFRLARRQAFEDAGEAFTNGHKYAYEYILAELRRLAADGGSGK